MLAAQLWFVLRTVNISAAIDQERSKHTIIEKGGGGRNIAISVRMAV